MRFRERFQVWFRGTVFGTSWWFRKWFRACAPLPLKNSSRSFVREPSYAERASRPGKSEGIR